MPVGDFRKPWGQPCYRTASQISSYTNQLFIFDSRNEKNQSKLPSPSPIFGLSDVIIFIPANHSLITGPYHNLLLVLKSICPVTISNIACVFFLFLIRSLYNGNIISDLRTLQTQTRDAQREHVIAEWLEPKLREGVKWTLTPVSGWCDIASLITRDQHQ